MFVGVLQAPIPICAKMYMHFQGDVCACLWLYSHTYIHSQLCKILFPSLLLILFSFRYSLWQWWSRNYAILHLRRIRSIFQSFLQMWWKSCFKQALILLSSPANTITSKNAGVSARQWTWESCESKAISEIVTNRTQVSCTSTMMK